MSEPSPLTPAASDRDAKGRFGAGNKLGNGGVSPWVGEARAKLEQGSVSAVEFCLRVMRGEEKDSVVAPTGEVVEVPPRLKERVKAAELLLSYGISKPKQELSVTRLESEGVTPEKALAALAKLFPDSH